MAQDQTTIQPSPANLFLIENAKREHAAMCVPRAKAAEAAETEHSPSLAQGMVGACASAFTVQPMTGNKLCCVAC